MQPLRAGSTLDRMPAMWQLYPSPQTDRGELLRITESIMQLYHHLRSNSPYSEVKQLEIAINKSLAHQS